MWGKEICIWYCSEGDTGYQIDDNKDVKQVQHGSALVRTLQHGVSISTS